MKLSDEAVREFQEIYKKKYGKEISHAEAYESASRLLGLFEVLLKGAQVERARKLRLKDEPKGFHINGGPYTCFICGKYVSDEETWYDKYGIKCLVCQRAVEKRVVPGKICQDKDSWYSMWELDHYFKIKHQTARKLIRQGKLKARVITSQDDDAYCFVFLIKENLILGLKPRSTLVKHENGRFSTSLEERTIQFD
ncbi:hypothetical protein IPG41_05320 [Candidatus Peregrinibacteria bacterium]|nr:MAG: hypothetical protein IPG41_05320 [Candidatus Peregrinibacteria bacterium]